MSSTGDPATAPDDEVRPAADDAAPDSGEPTLAADEGAGDASPEPTLLSAEDLRTVPSFAALYALYRERGAEGTDEELEELAGREWRRLADAEARALGKDSGPETLEPMSVERAGVRYDVYGLIHGHVGGDNEDYKGFVDARIGELDYVVFENGLKIFYRHKDGTVIPDFIVLGVLGSLTLGFLVGVWLPVLLYELVLELIKPKSRQQTTDTFEFDCYDRRYHALDSELRRAVDEEWVWPSQLAIERAIADRERYGVLATLRDPYQIAMRSMFMAGFAVGVAERRGDKVVNVVVGDFHAEEIRRCLERAEPAHPMFEWGRAWGRRSGLDRAIRYSLAKTIHLGFSGVVGALFVLAEVMLLAAGGHWLYGKLVG